MGGNGSSSQKPGKSVTKVDYTKIHAVYGNMTEGEINSFMSANIDSYMTHATAGWKDNDKEQYSAVIKKAFNSVSDSEMKVAYGKMFQNNSNSGLDISLNNTKNNSFYDVGSKTITLSKKTLGSSDEHASELVLHEFGHALDAHLAKSTRFASVSSDKIMTLKDEGAKAYTTILNKSDKAFNKALQLHSVSNSGIQDIVNGATSGKVQTYYQHANSYWKTDATNSVTETFANISEIKASGNKESLAYLEKYFSRTLDAHTNAVDEFINS